MVIQNNQANQDSHDEGLSSNIFHLASQRRILQHFLAHCGHGSQHFRSQGGHIPFILPHEFGQNFRKSAQERRGLSKHGCHHIDHFHIGSQSGRSLHDLVVKFEGVFFTCHLWCIVESCHFGHESPEEREIVVDFWFAHFDVIEEHDIVDDSGDLFDQGLMNF